MIDFLLFFCFLPGKWKNHIFIRTFRSQTYMVSRDNSNEMRFFLK